MSDTSKRLREKTKKLNIRLWTEDVEIAETVQHLMPGMSHHAVLREWVHLGRKQWEKERNQDKKIELPRSPVFK